MEFVILVDENDMETGQMEKLEAHRKAELHRAISVFVFNSKGEMLLQQRAAHKYHSAGLWTNACCSHPRPGEKTEDAAARRLKEEMGLDLAVQFRTVLRYRSEYENGLTENEMDHIFTAISDQQPVPDPEEVQAFAWKAPDEIKRELTKKPGEFTTWFKIAVERFF